MKKYVIKYFGFSNVYSLAYTETPEQFNDAMNNGYERITRKRAEQICAMENERAKCDPSFSGYGDNVIYPYDAEYHSNDYDEYIKRGYIMEKREGG